MISYNVAPFTEKVFEYMQDAVNNKKICGVCAGIAEYFDIDPTIVRLIWAAFTLAGGSGILVYIIAALVMDDNPMNIV